MRIIPALNIAPGNESVLTDRLDAVQRATDMVHLDVCDGTFTDNETWSDPTAWAAIAQGLKVQVHLMVANPEEVLEAWLKAGAAEIIIHSEVLPEESADAALERMRSACQGAGAKLILAGGKGVHAQELAQHAQKVDGLLLLAVTPGRAGQAMDVEVIAKKIRAIRESSPDITVWIDGGVNEQTIPTLRDSGATAAVAASAIFDTDSPIDAIAALQLL